MATKKSKTTTPVKMKKVKKSEVILDLPVAKSTGENLIQDELLASDDLVAEQGEGERSDRTEKYYESVGRRKEATARIRVYTKKSTDIQPSEERAIIIVNNKPYIDYFRSLSLQDIVDAPLRKLKSLNRFKATVKVSGGGMHGQADAIKFGLSRALVSFDPNFSKKLRKAGYLTRDSREKERRKYGLKKARKAPQWAKR